MLNFIMNVWATIILATTCRGISTEMQMDQIERLDWEEANVTVAYVTDETYIALTVDKMDADDDARFFKVEALEVEGISGVITIETMREFEPELDDMFVDQNGVIYGTSAKKEKWAGQMWTLKIPKATGGYIVNGEYTAFV